MSSNFLVGACVALGILGAWNTWALYEVNERLHVIEEMNPSTSKLTLKKRAGKEKFASYQQVSGEAKQEIKNKSKNRISVPGQDSDQPAFDLMDPEIHETIAKIAESNAQKKEEQRQKSKMEAYKTSIKYELEKFSTEKEYDTDTVQNIESILDESTVEWRAIREQVREGEISWIDARTEFKAIGEETEEKVSEFISEEDYKELRSRLWGDWGR